MNKNTIGIVTITRNNQQEVIKVFEDLKRQTYQNWILYVIDDYSQDLDEILSVEDERFKLIKYTGKYEFSYGNKFNFAFRAAISDELEYLYKIHTDMSFPNRNLLKSLKDSINGENVVLVGPTIYNGFGKKTWGPAIVKERCGHKICVTESYMVRSSYLLENNGFQDENFTWFMEESDFFLRIVYNGFKFAQIEEEIIHYGGATSSKFAAIKKFHRSRSSLLFLFKHNHGEYLHRNIRWLSYEMKDDIKEGFGYLLRGKIGLFYHLFYNMTKGFISAINIILRGKIKKYYKQ